MMCAIFIFYWKDHKETGCHLFFLSIAINEWFLCDYWFFLLHRGSLVSGKMARKQGKGRGGEREKWKIGGMQGPMRRGNSEPPSLSFPFSPAPAHFLFPSPYSPVYRTKVASAEERARELSIKYRSSDCKFLSIGYPGFITSDNNGSSPFAVQFSSTE